MLHQTTNLGVRSSNLFGRANRQRDFRLDFHAGTQVMPHQGRVGDAKSACDNGGADSEEAACRRPLCFCRLGCQPLYVFQAIARRSYEQQYNALRAISYGLPQSCDSSRL